MKRTAFILFLTFCTTGQAEQLRFAIKEPAGLGRGGYPVHGRLKLPRAVSAKTKFRLLHRGRVVVAQFRPSRPDKTSDQWWVDFADSIGPLELRKYVVEFGDEVKAGPERRSGHKLTTKGDAFIVSNMPYIDWTIPKDLRGLLHSVNFRPSEHLKRRSKGLMVRDQTGKIHVLGGKTTKAEVIRHGRMAVALRFSGRETIPALAGVHWTVDMVLPGPVSWVEIKVQLNDPMRKISQLGMQLKLNLDRPSGAKPTLAEFGAASVVYTSLYENYEMELRANSLSRTAWHILRGPRSNVRPFASATKNSPQAQGWAHVMDRKRCLGIAFDQFGKGHSERMRIQANGTLTAWRSLSQKENQRKSNWRMWLHFVHYPYQWSAGASPQQMQNPIRFDQVK